MTDRTSLAQIRFGTGLHPRRDPLDAAAMLDRLARRDRMAAELPIAGFAERAAAAQGYYRARRARRESDAAMQRFQAEVEAMRSAQTLQLATTFARGIEARSGLRERLTWFWADHFTTVGGRSVMRGSIAAYVEEAIRPHVAGRFGDMLEAAILHPVMILYLDQEGSVGPNSHNGRRQGGSLNENLAREVLELHTLGARAGYSQTDVREMAELLTGVGLTNGAEMIFRPGSAEPGAETVFGQSYGGAARANLSEVRAALQDLALRPETARHLSGKLADYFLADTPDPDLVAAMTATYQDTGGDLLQVMTTMMTDPRALAASPGRVKWPLHFMTSAMRALGVRGQDLTGLERRNITRALYLPMISMGQRFQGAAGPDGFFDDDREWIRPQALAARIGWAMSAAHRLRARIPDPRDFLGTALGDHASAELQWAAARAESRVDGVGLILASPDFMRS